MFSGPVMSTKNPDEVRYCCPFCFHDVKFHLYYNVRKELYHCFKCGKKGKANREVELLESRLEEIKDILEGKIQPTDATRQLVLPAVTYVNDKPHSDESLMILRYLRGRGIDREWAMSLNCMYCKERPYEDRVIIPIYDDRQKLSYYQARALLPTGKSKYLNPIYPKGRSLFWGKQPTGSDKELFIVEGIFKATRCAEAGLLACAILGKEMTAGQVESLPNWVRRVYVMLDPDALSYAVTIQEVLRVRRDYDQVRVVPMMKAPDDMTPKELWYWTRRMK